MKLKKIVIAATVALLGWFGIPRGIKLAQAYTTQQHRCRDRSSRASN
jgi:hypothetical protein